MAKIGRPSVVIAKRKTIAARFRCTDHQAKRILGMAKLYCAGNFSRYMRMALETFDAKFLKGTDDRKGHGRARYMRFRVTARELKMMKGRAKIYAGGNLSAWIRHCALNNTPRWKK